MRFMPMSVRRGQQPVFELSDGIPAHLKMRLIEWVEGFIVDSFRGGVRIEAVDLLITNLHWPIVERDPVRRYEAVLARISKDDVAFLDAIDLLCVVADEGQREALDGMLDAGLSRYRVNSTPPHGLEDRLTEEAHSAVTAAASGRDDASRHIAEAWAHAYGRDRNATAAWNSAVKAIEHLLQPIVEPKNMKATLGTMAAALRAKPEKWTFAIAAKGGDMSARPFVQALELIGYEPGRHGTDPQRATIEQARVVVLQAVAIVEWLRAGALTLATRQD